MHIINAHRERHFGLGLDVDPKVCHLHTQDERFRCSGVPSIISCLRASSQAPPPPVAGGGGVSPWLCRQGPCVLSIAACHCSPDFIYTRVHSTKYLASSSTHAALHGWIVFYNVQTSCARQYAIEKPLAETTQTIQKRNTGESTTRYLIMVINVHTTKDTQHELHAPLQGRVVQWHKRRVPCKGLKQSSGSRRISDLGIWARPNHQAVFFFVPFPSVLFLFLFSVFCSVLPFWRNLFCQFLRTAKKK